MKTAFQLVPATKLRLLAAMVSLLTPSALVAAGAKEPATRMEKYVVSAKHLLSFGIAITLWEDKNSGLVLEMYVTGVQEGGFAEQEGIISGTRIYGINGATVYSFPATFSSGSELSQLFVDRAKGDKVTLEVVKPGHRKSEFVTLVNESGFKATIRTKAPADGVALRAEENPQVYRALKKWEKKSLEQGEILAGFTTDMVYIALGDPTDKVTKVFGESQCELWTYQRCYPDPAAMRGFERESLTIDSVATGKSAVGSSQNQGSPEPAKGGTGVRPYTLQVLFVGGKVARMSAIPLGN